MKLKIISDGTIRGTVVVNAETGEALEGVREINWNLDAHSSFCVAEASIRLYAIPVELEAETSQPKVYEIGNAK